MFEGSRNEKVLIIICSYVIGFTTAYIAFGIISFDTDNLTQTATVYPTHEVITRTNANNDTNNVSVVRDSNGLFVKVGGEVREIVSVADSESTQSVDAVALPYAVSYYQNSPNGSFVYYCIQESSLPVCIPYIYEIATESSYALTIDGEAVSFSTDVARLNWDIGNILLGDGIRSISSETPWQVYLN